MNNKLTIEEARKVALEAVVKEKAMYAAHNSEEREAILPHLKNNSKDKLIEMYLDSAEQTMEAVNRLEWLLGRLEEVSDRNVVAKILEDYEDRMEKSNE